MTTAVPTMRSPRGLIRVAAKNETPLAPLSTRTMLEGLARAHPFVIAVDGERRIAWLSDDFGLVFPGAENCIGLPVETMITSLEIANRAEYERHVRAFVDELHNTGRVAAARFDLGVDPESIPIEVSAFRVQAEDGSMLSVCIAHRLGPDAPIAAEKKPLDPASRLAVMLDATPDGVLALDRLGFVTSANAAAAGLLGYTVDQLIGRSINQFVAESADEAEVAKSIARSIATNGAVASEEIKILRADGECAWVSISARNHAFVRTDGTESTELIVFIRDVSDRHVAREALENKNEELENYVRNVSHDLRSPLTSLLGFTRLLQDDYRDVLAKNGQQFLNRIEEAGRNMERLLHDLLELSRIGSTPQNQVRVDPRAVLLQLHSELKLRLEETRIELEIPPNPPTLKADRTRLYQLFSNLIGNAVVHMHPLEDRRRPARVHVEIEVEEGGWLLRVADNGPGIAVEDQERIFEMFETASTTNGRRKSSGLGLAIVKKIVESHSGRIWVESALGEGACFNVFLPDPDATPPTP